MLDIRFIDIYIRINDKVRMSSKMKKYKYLTNNETEALEQLIKHIKHALRDQLSFIKLFGSKSRGDFNSDSDVDVLLVIKNRTEEILDTIAEIHLEVDLKYDPHISLVIFSEDEYKKNEVCETPFIKNIHNEGVLL